MLPALRIPVADEVSPGRPLVSVHTTGHLARASGGSHQLGALPTTPSHAPTVDVVLHDGHRAQHAVIAGPDRSGAKALIHSIVVGAVERALQVHYIAPAVPPPAAVRDVVALHTGAAVARDPFEHAWDCVFHCATPRRHSLVVVDHPDLLLHGGEDRSFKLARLGATAGVSILLVVDRLGTDVAMRAFASANLFHLRSNNALDARDARCYLPNADIDALPLPDGSSYGITGSASALPKTFAVATEGE